MSMAPRRYFRPTGFVDTPVGFDGAVARVAGGLCFHALWEVIEVVDGRRIAASLVPVAALEPRDADEALTIARVAAVRAPLVLGERTIRLDQPQVMAILNVTPDSFSDGGVHRDPVADGVAMAAAGAAIVDVGGESTRPGATPVWEGDEIARVEPVVAGLARGGVAVSIDTRNAATMAAALRAGAGLVNDVAALGHDARAIELVADARCPVVLMHAPDPHDLHAERALRDPLLEVYDWLAARIAAVVAAGVARDAIIVDPGIGFGKSVAANLALINGVSLFHGLGCPILMGASRKRFIGALSNEAPADARLGGSLAVALAAAAQGVQLHRGHDVVETVQGLRVWRGLRDAALSAPPASA
jgi:dihydropteroate synthase